MGRECGGVRGGVTGSVGELEGEWEWGGSGSVRGVGRECEGSGEGVRGELGSGEELFYLPDNNSRNRYSILVMSISKFG